jgi:hypothetical protein
VGRNRLRVRAGRWLLKVTNAPTDQLNADGSRWPGSRRQFLWDLVPGEIAPGSDGVIPPERGSELDWTNTVAANDVMETYERARRYRQDADETTRNLELKASRFATFLVALATANVALVIFVLAQLRSNATLLTVLLVVASAGFGLRSARWLVPGLIQAVDADQRMGVTSVSTLDQVALDPRTAMRDEVHGFNTSNWTRRKKADTLIFARACVSRSLLSLIPSVLFALALVVNNAVTEDSAGGHHQHPGDHRHGITQTPVPTPTPTLAHTPSKAPTPTSAPTVAPTPKSTIAPTKTP